MPDSVEVPPLVFHDELAPQKVQPAPKKKSSALVYFGIVIIIIVAAAAILLGGKGQGPSTSTTVPHTPVNNGGNTTTTAITQVVGSPALTYNEIAGILPPGGNYSESGPLPNTLLSGYLANSVTTFWHMSYYQDIIGKNQTGANQIGANQIVVDLMAANQIIENVYETREAQYVYSQDLAGITSPNVTNATLDGMTYSYAVYDFPSSHASTFFVGYKNGEETWVSIISRNVPDIGRLAASIAAGMP